MKKILALAALAAVLFVVDAFAQMQVKWVGERIPVHNFGTAGTAAVRRLSKWFEVYPNVQGSLLVQYYAGANTGANDTLYLFLKSNYDTSTVIGEAVVSRDYSHLTTGGTGRGVRVSMLTDTLYWKMLPKGAGADSTKWLIPLPVFLYPGTYVSVWGGRDSTASSSAAVTFKFVGSPIR